MEPVRSDEYLQHVRKYPCIACISIGRKNYDVFAHHEDLSWKYRHYKRATDLVAVPLCLHHHEERHAIGKDKFWEKYLGDKNRLYAFVFILWKDFLQSKEIYDLKNLDEDCLLNVEGEFEIRQKFDEILDQMEKTMRRLENAEVKNEV